MEKAINYNFIMVVIALVFMVIVISLLGMFIYLMTRTNIEEKEEIPIRREEELSRAEIRSNSPED